MLRPIRPLPRTPSLEKAPNFGAIFYIYKYSWEVLKHLSLHFISLLKKFKELSNTRDRDKTNLNK